MSLRRFARVAVVVVVAVVAVGCVPPTPSAPTVSLEIEGGRAAINRSTVSLTVTASGEALEMRIGDGSGAAAVEGGSWGPVASSVPWSLPPGEGSRSVTVQVRNGEGVTATASASIVVDTTVPQLAVTSHSPGATVDVSHGELVALAGTASDTGSGVAGVTLGAPDGSTSQATLQPGAEWATPIGAPMSGSFIFSLTAIDVAGNTTVRSLPLNMLAMPQTGGTVSRPTTLQLTSTQVAALVSVTEESLVFTGDLRSALNGKTTLVSGPVTGLAPDGLLRSVSSVSFNATANRTMVATSDAQLVEAFAQFEFATPESPAGLRAPFAAADPCAAFVSGRSVRGSYQNSRTFGPDGANGGVGVTFSGTQAVYADLKMKVEPSWTGVKVSGSVGAGTMTCGSITANATAKFNKRLEFVSTPLFCGPVGPVPVCIEAEAGLRLDASLTSPTLFGEFHAGAEFSYRIGDDLDVSTPGGFEAGASPFSGKLSAGAYMKLNMTAAKVVESGLLDASAGPNLSATSSGVRGCVDLSAGFNPSLSLKVGRWKITAFDYRYAKTFSLFCRTWPFGAGTPSTSTTSTTSTTTTTTVPPNDDPDFIHMAPPERYAAGAWAASDGSWLIVERGKADGTSFTYQRVTENGQIAASWTSPLRPGSVVAGANGQVYVLGFIDDASTPLEQRKRIVRIGSDGPDAHRALALTNSSGNNTLAFGEDGNLYFLGHQDGDDWVMRLDPTSLVEQRRLRVQSPPVLDYAALPTPTGLMTLFWGHIPYSAFDSLPNESDWATYTAREIPQGRFSLGTDRSAVFANDGGYCNATEIARRAPSGQVWRRTVPQLVPDLPSQNQECYFRDVDAMPDGRVVITAEHPDERKVVQYWVAADGSSSEAVAVGSAPEGRYVDGMSTAVDRNGTAVTKYVRWDVSCPRGCWQHVVSGARDAEQQFSVDLPASPEGVAYWSASLGFLGTPELAIGVGQVLVPLAECSSRRCEGGLTMFISVPAEVEPSARPSFTHW